MSRSLVQGIGSERRRPGPAWQRGVLVLAGVYNLAWGAAVVSMPHATMSWLGAAPASDELWPSLWACIGMIVGVYGVGYLAASRDPWRHWPIVLVGLLGKVLGPIGFIDGAQRGLVPWSFGWTIITNDLIWWAPLGLILRDAWRSGRARGDALVEATP